MMIRLVTWSERNKRRTLGRCPCTFKEKKNSSRRIAWLSALNEKRREAKLCAYKGRSWSFFLHSPADVNCKRKRARCVNTHKRKSYFLYSFYLNRVDFLTSIYFLKHERDSFWKREKERLLCCCCCCCWKLFSPFPLFLFFYRTVFYLLAA